MSRDEPAIERRRNDTKRHVVQAVGIVLPLVVGLGLALIPWAVSINALLAAHEQRLVQHEKEIIKGDDAQRRAAEQYTKLIGEIGGIATNISNIREELRRR